MKYKKEVELGKILVDILNKAPIDEEVFQSCAQIFIAKLNAEQKNI